MLAQLDRLLERQAELDKLLSDPDIYKDQKRLKELGRERNRVNELVDAFKEYKQTLAALEEARQILKSGEDTELMQMATEEVALYEPKREALEAQLRRLLLPKDPNDERSVIIEIRAGTGGEESALFAADLFRMYSRYAETCGWKVEMMESSPTGLGGLKEIIFSVEGENVYSKMKYDSGTHRVQRVPQTEASGRIHTSAITVAIMPEADEVDVEITQNDIRIDVYRSSGHGGQSVNTTDSAVRITHLPTGLVVTCQDEKSQLKNKLKALKVLRARLLEKAVADKQREVSNMRRVQVGSGDRSEKIRTYNFPQNRLTDHRIGLTLYKLEMILNGDLEEIIQAMTVADEADRLRELSGGGPVERKSNASVDED